MTSQIKNSIDNFRDEILNEYLPYGHLLPSEKQLAETLQLSRPTVSKIYNTLKDEGLIQKKPGYGTYVIYKKNREKYVFGLLLPGAGESEIFGRISDHFLNLEKENKSKFLWDGAIANNAEMRQNSILDVCRSYIQNKVNGIFFVPLERVEGASAINKEIVNLIEKENIPIILIDRDICKFPDQSNYPVVGLDNYNAGYVMAEHIIRRGCEIVYFLCRKDSANSVDKRIVGCKSACFDLGINFEASNLLIGDPSDMELIKQIKIIPGKTGVICANDSTAAIFMSSVSGIDIRISKDILVAGFDNMKYSQVLGVPLTTYQQPLEDIVMISYEMMFNRVSNPKRIPINIEIPGKIIPRKSTEFSKDL